MKRANRKQMGSTFTSRSAMGTCSIPNRQILSTRNVNERHFVFRTKPPMAVGKGNAPTVSQGLRARIFGLSEQLCGFELEEDRDGQRMTTSDLRESNIANARDETDCCPK